MGRLGRWSLICGWLRNIGIRIKVSTPVDYDRPENQHMTEVEISTLYSELGLFAEHVTQMVKGQTKEAILEPTP